MTFVPFGIEVIFGLAAPAPYRTFNQSAVTVYVPARDFRKLFARSVAFTVQAAIPVALDLLELALGAALAPFDKTITV